MAFVYDSGTWDDLKERAAIAFTYAFTTWVDQCRARNVDGEQAYTALITYIGHALGGVAVELDVHPNSKETAALIAELMESSSDKIRGSS